MFFILNDSIPLMYQVRKLLVDDPGNSEYVDMEKELEEVIFIHISSPLHLFIIFFSESFFRHGEGAPRGDSYPYLFSLHLLSLSLSLSFNLSLFDFS